MTQNKYFQLFIFVCVYTWLCWLLYVGVKIEQLPKTMSTYDVVFNMSEPRPTDGSVLFWQDSLLVKPIVRNTGSHITHAVVILKGYVYEATPPCVRKVRLSEYVKEMRAKSQRRSMQRCGFKWFIMLPNVQYTDAQVQAMVRYAESQLGRPYMLRGWWKGHEVRGIFCSQYASNVIEKGGRIKSDSIHESPGSLYKKLLPLYTQGEMQ